VIPYRRLSRVRRGIDEKFGLDVPYALVSFLAFLAARFSLIVLVAFFFVSFLASVLLLMVFAPCGDAAQAINKSIQR